MAISYIPPSGGVNDYNKLKNVPIKDGRFDHEVYGEFNGDVDSYLGFSPLEFNDLINGGNGEIENYVTDDGARFIRLCDDYVNFDGIKYLKLDMIYGGEEVPLEFDESNVYAMTVPYADGVYMISEFAVVVTTDKYEGLPAGVYAFYYPEYDGSFSTVLSIQMKGKRGEIVKLDSLFMPDILTIGTRSNFGGTSYSLKRESHVETLKKMSQNKSSDVSAQETSGEQTISIPYNATIGMLNCAENGSLAIGQMCYATGACSYAQGGYTVASGVSSHAEGIDSYAKGMGSHAEGTYTTSEGDFSHAEGESTLAYGYCQHVQGKYNITDEDGEYAHIVGNGTSYSKRSNAHTLDWDGNAWYKGEVYVGGTAQDSGKKLLSTADINFDADGNLVITINGVTKKFAPIG